MRLHAAAPAALRRRRRWRRRRQRTTAATVAAVTARRTAASRHGSRDRPRPRHRCRPRFRLRALRRWRRRSWLPSCGGRRPWRCGLARRLAHAGCCSHSTSSRTRLRPSGPDYPCQLVCVSQHDRLKKTNISRRGSSRRVRGDLRLRRWDPTSCRPARRQQAEGRGLHDFAPSGMNSATRHKDKEGGEKRSCHRTCKMR